MPHWPQEHNVTPDDFGLGDKIVAIAFSDAQKYALPHSLAAFVQALPDVFDDNALLEIETRNTFGRVSKLLDAAQEIFPLPGTVTERHGKRRVLELPVTQGNMERLAALSDDIPSVDVQFLSVVRRTEQGAIELLLQWDAEGFSLGGQTTAAQRRAFADKLSVHPVRWKPLPKPRPRWRLYGSFNIVTFMHEALALLGSDAKVILWNYGFPAVLVNLKGAAFDACTGHLECDLLHIPLTVENIEALESAFTQEDLQGDFEEFSISQRGDPMLLCSDACRVSVFAAVPKSRIDSFCRETGMTRLRWWQRR